MSTPYGHAMNCIFWFGYFHIPDRKNLTGLREKIEDEFKLAIQEAHTAGVLQGIKEEQSKEKSNDSQRTSKSVS